MEMASQGKQSGVRGVSWREQETADLIAIWGDEKIQAALAKGHKNMEVFETVAKKMQSLGYPRSGVECRTKTKALHAVYRIVVSSNKQTGRAPSTCPFFKELDAILHGDGSARPNRLSCPTQMKNNKPGSEKSPRRQTKSHSACSTQPQPLSQVLFHRDLVMIDEAVLRCSTPAGSHSPPLESLAETGADVVVARHETSSASEELAVGEESVEAGDNIEQSRDDIENVDEVAHPGRENIPPPQPPLAELGAEDRLEIMRRHPRVAVLSDISRRLIQQSRIEHREIMRQIEVEGERDRALMERNFRIMESAVDIMADIRDIFCESRQGDRLADNARQQPHTSMSEVPTRGLVLAPLQEEDSQELLVEDTQALMNEGAASVAPASQSILSGPQAQCGSQRVRVIRHAQGTNEQCLRERRCRGQKRERYSPS